jgi:thiol-disulfide isomerase/thioredoxin
MAGCNQEAAPITAQNSKFKVGEGSGTAKTKSPATDAVDADGGMPAAEPPQGLPVEPAAATDAKKSATTPPPGDKSGNKTVPSAVPPITEDKDGNLTLSGEVAQVVEFIKQLKSSEPPGASEEEQLQNMVLAQRKIIELATYLIDKNAHPKLNQFAVGEATQGLLALAQLGDPSAPTRMTLFADKLSQHPNADLARTGRVMKFNTQMIEKLQAEGKVDTTKVLQGISDLLDKDGGDEEVFLVSTRICQFLTERGESEAAAKGMRLIAASYKDSENKELSAAAKSLNDSATVTELNVPQLLDDVYDKKEGADEKLLGSLEGLVKDKNPNPIYISPVLDVISRFELLDRGDMVERLYGILETAFIGHENEQAAKIVTELISSGRKRYGLVGKPLELDAVTATGEKLDLKSYEGKVVLLNVWSTFAGPSLEQMPQVRKLYTDLKSEGFEVIGLNVDIDPKRVESFFKFQQDFVPFANYQSPDVVSGAFAAAAETAAKTAKEDNSGAPSPSPASRWNETALAKQLGLQSIPFYVLIDKQGNVDSIYHYRLDPKRLGERLKDLLGLKEVPDFIPKPMPIFNPNIPSAPAIPDAAPPDVVKPADPAKSAEPPAEPVKPAEPAKDTPAPKEQGSWFQQWNQRLVTGWLSLSTSAFLADEENANADSKEADGNPYLAKPDLTSKELTDWMLKMLDKPKTIQSRPGFAAAIVDACNRVLANTEAKDTEKLLAVENKLAVLHRAACNDDAEADKQLQDFLATLQGDSRPRVAREVAFLTIEHKVLSVDALSPADCEKLLLELKAFYGQEKLAAKHLRMASGTVEVINKLEDGDAREKHFAEFGALFAKSSDKELARYGKKLAKKPETKESDLVGKPLELVGVTAAGTPFSWENYRGKVVIVDFWATWCGPCRKEMPNVVALREKLKDRGFEVVGVSVDKDEEALATYLEENHIPWETLAGEGASELAEKYGVRGIPTMMLVDQKGTIVAVAHNVAALAPEAEKLLGK